MVKKSGALQILKSKEGMTLIETVITFIIAGILIAATGALIITGLNLYQDTAARNLNKQIGDSVLDLTSKQLLYAKSIDKEDTSPVNMDAIGTDAAMFVGTNAMEPLGNGYLYIKDPGTGKSFHEAYSKDFYSGRKITLQLTVDKVTVTKAVTLTVQVLDDGKVGYERSTSLQLLNCGKDDPPLVTGAWDYMATIKYTLVE